MKSIKITEKQWIEIVEKIKKQYPPSFYLIREKMREKLGFTCRLLFLPGYNHETYLDFFDEKKKTMFLLKYGDILGDKRDQ
jgi:hypothetical protein